MKVSVKDGILSIEENEDRLEYLISTAHKSDGTPLIIIKEADNDFTLHVPVSFVEKALDGDAKSLLAAIGRWQRAVDDPIPGFHCIEANEV